VVLDVPDREVVLGEVNLHLEALLAGAATVQQGEQAHPPGRAVLLGSRELEDESLQLAGRLETHGDSRGIPGLQGESDHPSREAHGSGYRRRRAQA
jgi:hypothetical protein